MAVGSVQRLPRFAADGKTVVPASIINLSLGADHRWAAGLAEMVLLSWGWGWAARLLLWYMPHTAVCCAAPLAVQGGGWRHSGGLCPLLASLH